MNPSFDRSCPICSNTKISFFAKAKDIEYFTTPESFTYLCCRNCSAVFLDNPPVDRLSEIYPDNYYASDESFNTSFIQGIKQSLDKRLFRKLLNKIPGDTISALDIGGGFGWELNILKQSDSRVQDTAVLDIDESARKKAEAAGHKFFVQRVEEFKSEKKYDFILMLNIIEHVVDPVAVLQSVRKLLTPNGMVLIKTPNTNSLDRYIFQHKNWGGFHCPRHFVLFNKTNLTMMTKQCGFDMEWFAYTQGSGQWSVSIFGLLNKYGLININAEKPAHLHFLWNPASMITAAFDMVRGTVFNTAQMFCALKLSDE